MASPREVAWLALSTGSGIAAAVGTRRLLGVVWERITGREVPDDPADRSTSWPEALAWVAAVSIGAGVARLVAERSAVAAWETATGEAPPGVDRPG